MNNTLTGYFDYCVTDVGGIGLTVFFNGVFNGSNMTEYGIDRLALGVNYNNVLAHFVNFNPSNVMATAIQFLEKSLLKSAIYFNYIL